MIKTQMTFILIIHSMTHLLLVLVIKDYLLGGSGHKPIVSPLNSNRNHTNRFGGEQFRLHFMRFFFTIVHVPGKELQTDDTLSIASVSEGDDSREEAFCHKVKAYVKAVMRNLPYTDSEERLRLIRDEQIKDLVCRKLKECCEKSNIDWNGLVKKYFKSGLS